MYVMYYILLADFMLRGKMKRLAVLIMILCVIFPAFGSLQKLYDYTDEEYILVDVLCAMSSVPGPSSASPVTERELELAFDRIDYNRLSDDAKRLYAYLAPMFENDVDSFSMNLTPYLNPQMYLSTEYDIPRYYFALPYPDEAALIGVDMEFHFGRNVFLEGNIGAFNSPTHSDMFLTNAAWLINYKDGHWNFLGQNGTGIYGQVPTLARGAIGNDWINLVTGRTPHKLGAGESNLLVDDNFLYQELFKLSFVSNNFTYNIDITHFDNQLGETTFSRPSFDGKHQMRVIHRFDINFFDCIRFVANLGTLYYADNAFDFRFIIPLMVAHNYYNYQEKNYLVPGEVDEANNTFAFELEINIIDGLKLSSQFILDQFQVFFEDQSALPAAYGAMLNLSYTGACNSILYSAYVEGVYTSPFLYLNEKYEAKMEGNEWTADYDKRNYNYDYILGYWGKGLEYPQIGYSGYEYGPDCIGVSLGCHLYSLENEIRTDLALSFVINGEKGIGDSTFSGDTPYYAVTPTGTLEYIISGKCDLSWWILPDTLELQFGAYLTWYGNHNHIASASLLLPQAMVGCRWNII